MMMDTYMFDHYGHNDNMLDHDSDDKVMCVYDGKHVMCMLEMYKNLYKYGANTQDRKNCATTMQIVVAHL